MRLTLTLLVGVLLAGCCTQVKPDTDQEILELYNGFQPKEVTK